MTRSIGWADAYLADSPPSPEGSRKLLAYPIRSDGALDLVRVLHDFGPPRGIDGVTVDSGGAIAVTCGWAKSGPGTRIAVFAPEGRLPEEHLVPAEPTNYCFGGADTQTLFVTAKGGRLYAHSDRHGLPLVPRP